jgi:hypothetical protein
MISLSEELQRAVDEHADQPVWVVDERTNMGYVLLRADVYEQMQAAAEAESDIRVAYPLMDAVARQEGWDDPEMDSYNIHARKTP